MAVPVPVKAAPTLMLLCALSVSLFADQLTEAPTLMSPASLPFAAAAVAIVTLPPPRLADSVAAPMLLVVATPLPATMAKLVGSISQVPAPPLGAAVDTRAPTAMLTLAAEVSTKPPLPLAALASMLPDTCAMPRCMSPISITRPPSPPFGAAAWIWPAWLTLSPVIQISPPRSTSVLARISPLLLTSEAAMSWAEAALSRTTPPSARMLPLLTTEPAAPGVTTAEMRPLPLMLTVAARPEASTTWPASTAISPWLSTRLPKSAR